MQMLSRWRIPIGVWLGLVAVPLVLAGSAFSVRELGRARDRERIDRGAALASLLAKSVESAGAERTGDNGILVRLAEYAGRGLGMDYAMVVDREGRILQHTDIGRVHSMAGAGGWETAAHRGIATRTRRGTGEARDDADGRMRDAVEFAAPILGADGPRGAAVVALSTRGGGLTLADARPFLIPAAFMLLLIPVTFFVVRLSVRPLLATGEELRQLLASQQIPGLPALRGAEPGAVAAAMREMVREFMRVFREQEDRCNELELELRVQEFERRRFEALIERVPEGVVLEGPDGRIELVNQAAGSLLGVDPGALVAGSAPAEGLLGDGAVAARGRGRHESLDVSAVPIVDQDRTLLGTLHLVRDVSGTRELEQAQHEFVSHLAHEVKSPLNTIRSYTGMLLDGDIEDLETRKEFFNTINDEAARLSRLIENLLHLSRIEMGHVRLEKQFVKTQNLVEHAITAISPNARAKGLDLRVSLPDRMGSLAGDRQLLEVAVINILGNAVKYTPSGGTVNFSVEERPDGVDLVVADTGPGIRPEDQQRVFEKFFRSDAPEVAGQPGHGLGLSLTREIVELHGGSIRLDSAPGRGSTFTIHIPVGSTDEDKTAAAALQSPAPVPVAVTET